MLSGPLAISRRLGVLILVGLLILFLWLTIRVDLVIFGGILLAIALRRCAAWVGARTGIGVGWGLAVVLLLVVLVLSGIGWFFSQTIAGQITELSVQLPAAFHKVVDGISRTGPGRAFLSHLDRSAAAPSPTRIAKTVLGIAAITSDAVGALIVVMFVAIYAAAETPIYTGGLLRLVPPLHRERAAEILGATANAVWYWLLGRLFAMTVVGVMATVGLLVLGVPLPFALGFLAGTMTFVPYLGSVASAVPSVLLAAATSLHLAIYVIALYVGIHLFEGYILVPLVQRRFVHLPPALTLSAQVLLYVLAGFTGLLLATPLVAAGVVLVQMIYIEGVLGDHPDLRPGR